MSVFSKLLFGALGAGAGAGGAAVLGRRTTQRALTAAQQTDAEALEHARVAGLLDPVTSRPEPPNTVTGPVTDALYARLTDEDHEALAAVIEGSARDIWEQTPPAHRMRLSIVLSAHYGLTGALERLRMSDAVPPEDVHSMARGPLSRGGDVGIGDVVTQAFADAGYDLPDGATVLDFGCSSGRVLRALAAWREDLDCVGCDPNAPAIAWAQEHLPMARFFVSPNAPPLDLPDASVDAAFAISIWSHFAEQPALDWLAEMHRIVKPGGMCLVTTHGLDTLGSFVRGGAMNRESAAQALATMLTSGHEYYDVFGEEGDWGVKDPGWGNAYLSLDWLTEHVTPQWSVRLFRPAALAANQDVTVLERRP